MEILANGNILDFAKEAWSSAVMVIMILSLLYMLGRSQNKYTTSNDKYAELIKQYTETQEEQIQILKAQNEKLRDIFYIMNSCQVKPCNKKDFKSNK